MARISYLVTKPEGRLILRIAQRALREIQELTAKRTTVLDVALIITACHANGCTLQLLNLLSANPVDFARDVLGIYKHLVKATGALEGFEPRYRAHRRAA